MNTLHRSLGLVFSHVHCTLPAASVSTFLSLSRAVTSRHSHSSEVFYHCAQCEVQVPPRRMEVTVGAPLRTIPSHKRRDGAAPVPEVLCKRGTPTFYFLVLLASFPYLKSGWSQKCDFWFRTRFYGNTYISVQSALSTHPGITGYLWMFSDALENCTNLACLCSLSFPVGISNMPATAMLSSSACSITHRLLPISFQSTVVIALKQVS